MMLAAIADWIMGNTVSSVVFGTFGKFLFIFLPLSSFQLLAISFKHFQTG